MRPDDLAIEFEGMMLFVNIVDGVRLDISIVDHLTPEQMDQAMEEAFGVKNPKFPQQISKPEGGKARKKTTSRKAKSGTPVKYFSPRHLLRDREALLVHFNTPQSKKHSTGYPEDLRDASALKGEYLSFCTIRREDRGPSQVVALEEANSGGSIGIVVDVNDTDSILRVSNDDHGTDGDGEGFGDAPTESALAKSIDERNGINEWRVRNYDVVGIFVFVPAYAFLVGRGEFKVDLKEVASQFPDKRIFTAQDGSFCEYDRQGDRWSVVDYSDIVPGELVETDSRD